VTGGRAGGSRVRTVFLGSGGFGAPSLARLARHADIDVVGVVTAPPRPAGRAKRLTPTPIDDAARSLGIDPILTPERLRDVASIDAILALEPSLAVLADYGQIVPPVLLDLEHGALNLHPSLLPRHRGATPIPAAIIAGDRETGVTLIYMDVGLDTGPIIAQRAFTLDGSETAPSLEADLRELAGLVLVEALRPWLWGAITSHPQPEEGATMTRPLRREDGRLDPTRPAATLERQIRAYRPWPGSFIDTAVGRIVVWEAGVRSSAGGPPGTFDWYGLSTVEGDLQLHAVQPAGGTRMSWVDFLRGRPGIVGSTALASDRDA
jgi:methionyl-tRNA formyltransferase